MGIAREIAKNAIAAGGGRYLLSYFKYTKRRNIHIEPLLLKSLNKDVNGYGIEYIKGDSIDDSFVTFSGKECIQHQSKNFYLMPDMPKSFYGNWTIETSLYVTGTTSYGGGANPDMIPVFSTTSIFNSGEFKNGFMIFQQTSTNRLIIKTSTDGVTDEFTIGVDYTWPMNQFVKLRIERFATNMKVYMNDVLLYNTSSLTTPQIKTPKDRQNLKINLFTFYGGSGTGYVDATAGWGWNGYVEYFKFEQFSSAKNDTIMSLKPYHYWSMEKHGSGYVYDEAGLLDLVKINGAGDASPQYVGAASMNMINAESGIYYAKGNYNDLYKSITTSGDVLSGLRVNSDGITFAMTLSADFAISAYKNNQYILCTGDINTLESSILFKTDGYGGVDFALHARTAVSTKFAPKSNWNTFFLKFDKDNNMSVYVNGSLASSVKQSSSPIAAQVIRLLSSHQQWGMYGNGINIKDVSIFDRNLSQADMLKYSSASCGREIRVKENNVIDGGGWKLGYSMLNSDQNQMQSVTSIEDVLIKGLPIKSYSGENIDDVCIARDTVNNYTEILCILRHPIMIQAYGNWVIIPMLNDKFVDQPYNWKYPNARCEKTGPCTVYTPRSGWPESKANSSDQFGLWITNGPDSSIHGGSSTPGPRSAFHMSGSSNGGQYHFDNTTLKEIYYR